MCGCLLVRKRSKSALCELPVDASSFVELDGDDEFECGDSIQQYLLCLMSLVLSRTEYLRLCADLKVRVVIVVARSQVAVCQLVRQATLSIRYRYAWMCWQAIW